LAALTPTAAVRSISAFHRGIAGNKSVLMVAFNSHFDAAFVDHLFRNGGGDWRDLYHYFILDLPSMAWSLGMRGLTGQSLSEQLGVEDEPHVAELHTGITGARLNARLYRALASLPMADRHGEYKEYVSRAPDFVKKHSGQYIVRGGEVQVMEGTWKPERLVIVSFPSREHATAFLNDPEYQAIAPIRQTATTSNLLLVEGFEA
jgi:uncharacterized protein (DUF1330 family)